MSDRLKVSLVLASLRTGGAERAMLNLANGFESKGIETEFVVVEKTGEFISLLKKNIELIDLQKKRTKKSFFAFRKYLLNKKPDVLVVAQTHVQLMAIAAILITRWKGILILNEQSTFSENTKNLFMRLLTRVLFRRANAITFVSAGSAADFARRHSALTKKIQVISNPVFSEEILKLRNEKISHPFLTEKKFPVILTAGRLSQEKNYKFLLVVFAEVIKQKEARLIILGEGEERNSLMDKVKSLGLQPYVSLPGNVINPFAYMSVCDVFTLTSDYEGLPSVLIEALACGCNIVSTDCPNGPSEILEKGKFGTLVSPGDKRGFSDAILNSLFADKHTNEKLARARDFSIEKITDQYIKLIRQLQ